MADTGTYATRFDIDYQEPLDRLTTFFRLLWAIPILVIVGLLNSGGTLHYVDEAGQTVRSSGGGIGAGLFAATVLMLLFRQRYPRWWFDFGVEFARFGARVSAYLLLLTDAYPSTVDHQAVHLDIDYPDAQQLNRWLPLVKWLLAIPHYIALAVLGIIVVLVTILAWFAILFTRGGCSTSSLASAAGRRGCGPMLSCW